jgi:magnesium and cobalt transporter
MPKREQEPKLQNTSTRKTKPNNGIKVFFNSMFNTIKELCSSTETRKISQEEELLLNNLSKFGEKTVGDAMLPRSSIIALPSNATLKSLSEVINKFSHTRIFIYEDSLDNITGFVHIKDLFKLVTKKQTFQLSKIIRKPIISTLPMNLLDLLKEMQQKRTHIAMVINEYGDTEGMITIEDIVEEIFGEIDDEHDQIVGDKNYTIINSNSILANARASVEVLEDLLKVKLKKDKDEFESIGGLVLATVGSVPPKGTKINISDDVQIEVMDSTPRVLKKIKLTLKDNK